MKKKKLKVFPIIIFIILLAFLGFVIILRAGCEPKVPEPTATPTPSAKPTPVVEKEPEPEYFTISLVGDNTISNANGSSNFSNAVGDDMGYPYANTKEYFENDDLSIANLECVLSDKRLYSDSLFSFLAPTKNAEILNKGSIEFVTTANNHTRDFGQTGIDDTAAALEKAGISYGLDGETSIIKTESGLCVGIYCATGSSTNSDRISNAVSKMRGEGAEFIICALHWGDEGKYRPTEYQKSLAHAAIDAGADLVYGSHPHVLQPVEEYGDGLILYSLGNWCFGGNSWPKDLDTAIIQVTVMRDLDGKISIYGYDFVPCSMSSANNGRNDYKPTPYAPGSEAYKRVISKLDGSFTGPDLVVDYSQFTGGSSTPTPTPAPSSPPATDIVTDPGGGTEEADDEKKPTE